MNHNTKYESRRKLVSRSASLPRRCKVVWLLLLPMLNSISGPTSYAQSTVVAPQVEALSPYLMDRSEEIALAQSAAPPSISQSAAVLVLTVKGYEYVSRGTNGFECLVQRGWMNDLQDPDYGSPALRSPMCLNPAAVRLYLPLIKRRTELARERASRVVVKATIDREFAEGISKVKEQGAMCYMMSKGEVLRLSQPSHPSYHVLYAGRTPKLLGGKSAGISNLGLSRHRRSPQRLHPSVSKLVRWFDRFPQRRTRSLIGS